MKKLFALIITVALFASPLLAGENSNPELKKIKKLYIEAEFEQVVIDATSLLEQSNLSRADSIEAIRLLSVSLAQENNLELSEKYLLVLIKLNPDTDFNSRKISKRFEKVWHKVLRETNYVPGHKQKLLTVAVIEFANGSFVDADKVSNVGIGMAAMISYALEESGDIHTPSRENINSYLDELRLSQTDFVDADQKLDIGRIIGVRNYISGTFYNMPKKQFRIDARIIETETTMSKKHFSVTGKSNKLGELTAELARLTRSNRQALRYLISTWQR